MKKETSVQKLEKELKALRKEVEELKTKERVVIKLVPSDLISYTPYTPATYPDRWECTWTTSDNTGTRTVYWTE